MAGKLDGFEEGMRLHAIYAADGEYYPATVVTVSKAKNRSKKPVKVSYTGYDEEVWVALDSLKSKKLGLKPKAAVAAQAEAPKAKASGKAAAKATGKAAAKGKAKAQAKEPVKKPDFSGLTKDLKLQVKDATDGKFYSAEVVAVSKKKEQVKIHWVGYTNASDEWVGADRIRSKHLKFTTAKPETATTKAAATKPAEVDTKNSAFVFIKPHAVTDGVKALAKTCLESHGIKILKEGKIKGEVIDKKKLIDQHYYAIASKATILKPEQLNVPEDKFQAQFGLSWKDALASGKVFNAMDGCAKFGIDADQMDEAWAKAKAAKKLVKFGGGFYCGLVEVEGKDPLYIFNGFFMAMRSKFTQPGTQIYYYNVEWQPHKLSWADFRAKVLGPTDPADAPSDSLRGLILDNWQKLGLKAEPNVGDNGMHASASPFEAFAERNNWLGVPIAKDRFASRMLAARIPMGAVKAWSVDPQILVEGEKKGSVFDALEDLNIEQCLNKCVELAKLNKPATKNSAFVFIKPHAVTDKVKELAKAGLEKHGLKITKEGSIKAETIDKKKLIDQHYYAIASKATILKPEQLNVPEDKFQAQFGLSWKDALASGKVFNAMDGCAKLGIDADQMDTAWGKCKAAKKLIKFGGGFYCGLIEIDGKDPLYIFNGFFMAMRSKFTKPGTEIHYYVVEWEQKELSWADFRGKVLGPTDPAEAPKDSLRGQILADWKDLGLEAEPNVGDNGMHASASPFEGLAERNNWLGFNLAKDKFGQLLLAEKVSMKQLREWTVDPQVTLEEGGKQGSLFDSVEDLDADPCVAKLAVLAKLNKPPVLNAAFVFIKPHAVTDKVKALAKAGLEKHGIKIVKEGAIKAEVIDKNKLIDQHYYSIASKATILKPAELNVPEEMFHDKFGLPWNDAVAAGQVFNAKDGCKHLKLSAQQMDEQWAKAKAEKNLIKFGGGFYCGMIAVEGNNPIYVLNGFFMAMRSKFTKKGESIYYYSVEWDPAKLSWADFRGKVLGPTDPAEAPKDSLRGEILAGWQELGLKEVPNVGDNGMHASASPFEALAERNNWLGAPFGKDRYGQELSSEGVTQDVLRLWSLDPQVALGATAGKGSIFDALEDMDAVPCLEKMVKLAKVKGPSTARRGTYATYEELGQLAPEGAK